MSFSFLYNSPPSGREENYTEKRKERMTVEDNKERGRTKMETLSDKGPES